VGYNDTDPKKRYWIMLNSWGVTKGRPDGLFMVSMDLNYSCTYPGLGNAYYWMTLDANFAKTSSDRLQTHLGPTQKGLKRLAPLQPPRLSLRDRPDRPNPVRPNPVRPNPVRPNPVRPNPVCPRAVVEIAIPS
jgi:hypothetical protein